MKTDYGPARPSQLRKATMAMMVATAMTATMVAMAMVQIRTQTLT